MKIENEIRLDYNDVLLVPQRSSIRSRADIDLTINFFDLPVIPIIAANMDGVGTFEMAAALAKHKCLTTLTKHYSLEELVEYYSDDSLKHSHEYTIYSLGTAKADVEKFKAFVSALEEADRKGPLAICIDVANGYTHSFEDFVTAFAETYPQFVLVVGNVATPDQTERLLECGADVVKIGIGPGSVCTTRRQTGVGYPQLSAVLECSEAARDAGGMIIADGGCTCPGDVAKAFAAGAHLVMLGGMLAGCDEGGQIEYVTRYYGSAADPHSMGGGAVVKEPKVVQFYGMASKHAQNTHNGGLAEYRASEGKEVSIPYRGPVNDVVIDLLGGLRSSCSYIGAERLDQLHRCGKFISVNRQLNEVFK